MWLARLARLRLGRLLGLGVVERRQERCVEGVLVHVHLRVSHELARLGEGRG